MTEVSVIGVKSLTEGTYLLEMQKPFDFIAGQLINLTVYDLPARVYSLAGGINDQYLSVLFDVKPNGKITPHLKKLKAGDRISISEPFGNFICDNSPAYWVANGTGIAPFYSMMRSGTGVNKILVHGGRTADSFYFQKEFKTRMGGNYIRCCTQEQGDGLYNGRLTQYLQELNDLPLHYKYYLCGSAEMVVDVRDILILKGIPFDQIFAEIFF